MPGERAVTQINKVQVLLSTYNGEKFIAEQLESVLAQENVDLSILIRDDGSTDRTVEIIERYSNLHSDQIHLIQSDNRKLPASFFELIRLASGTDDYYAFCDQDDIWEPGKLSRAVNRLRKVQDQEQPLLYCSATTMVDQSLNLIGEGPAQPGRELTIHNALVENVAIGCTSVFNQRAMELVRKHLPFEYGRIVMHDWWLYLSVAVFGKVMFDSESYIRYRQHGGNTLGGSANGFMKWKKRIQRYFGGRDHIYSNQAAEFLNCYHDELDLRYRELLQKFIASQQNDHWAARVRYALHSPLYRQSAADQIVFKILFMLGKA